MADPKMTNNNSSDSNETIDREQPKADVRGGSDRQHDQSGMEKEREDKSAIGSQNKSDDIAKTKSQSEVNKDRTSEPTGQR